MCFFTFDSLHLLQCIVFLVLVFFSTLRTNVWYYVGFFSLFFSSVFFFLRFFLFLLLLLPGILIFIWINMALHFQGCVLNIDRKDRKKNPKNENKFLTSVNLYRYWYMLKAPYHIAVSNEIHFIVIVLCFACWCTENSIFYPHLCVIFLFLFFRKICHSICALVFVCLRHFILPKREKGERKRSKVLILVVPINMPEVWKT